MPVKMLEGIAKVKGMQSDHAEDQKALSRGVESWKRRSDRLLRGERAILSMNKEDLLPILWQASRARIEELGGLTVWEQLSDAEREVHNLSVYQELCADEGEQAFGTLSEEEQRTINLYIWAGCCMHKEMNSVKGGNKRMMAFWNESGLTPPVSLMNRDNAAAAALGSSGAKQRAGDVSQAGAVKTTSLAGAIFHHKDDKKGQQDSLSNFWEFETGNVPTRFPDTSNIRYQSHCEAASELIVGLPLYIKFLDQVRDKKETRTLNHMEANVYKALNDTPTVTELCVLAIYSLLISHPYMRKIRGSDMDSMNVLDLAPFHRTLKDHCRQIINNPNIILAADASYKTATLDGQIWERSDTFYAVQKLIPTLPHINGAVVAFFEGALETWERFTSEFHENSSIALASPSERRGAHMRSTNDHNEGALGAYRVHMRQAPWTTPTSHNSRMVFK